MLTADITSIPRPDSPPEVLSHLGIIEGTTVSIPHLDARTATIPDLSMYDPKVQPLFDWDNWTDETLAVALRVRYIWPGVAKIPVFHGPIHAPDFDYPSGKITINARDPSFRLEKTMFVKGDDVLDMGYRLDGRGAQLIVEGAQNRPNQDDLNWPSLGINVGIDTATHTTLRRTAQRGDQAWSTLRDLAQLQIGPDFELEPYETDPTVLAVGPVTDNTDQNVPAGATTDYTLNVGLAGIIEGFRLGVYVRATTPSLLDLYVVHPDGTVIQLYDGTRDRNKSSSGGDMFGTSDANLMFFADFGDPLYGTNLSPSTFPKVGRYRSEDGLLSGLADKVAAGVWKLRIHNRGGTAATLKAWSLRFQVPEPAYVRLNTSDKPPEVPTMDAKFHDGEGPNNASITVSPIGESTVNWARFGGAKGAAEAIRKNDVSREKIGTLQDWQTTDQSDTAEVVQGLADRTIGAYSYPPPAITIKPDDDRGQADLPRLCLDYKVGGHVLGVAKKGYARHRVPARVTNGILRNAGGTVQTDLTVIPVMAPQADVGDG